MSTLMLEYDNWLKDDCIGPPGTSSQTSLAHRHRYVAKLWRSGKLMGVVEGGHGRHIGLEYAELQEQLPTVTDRDTCLKPKHM